MESMARTRKGRRESARILAVATTVMARDGISGATLGRIAAEADVDKRMIAYYFGTREALWAEVLRSFGRHVAELADVAIQDHTTPFEIASAAVEAIWKGSVVDEPELTRAYVVLAAGRSNSNPVRLALDEITTVFTELFERGVAMGEAAGFALDDDLEFFVTAMFAMLRGMLVEWSEHGDSPALAGARETFKRVAAVSFRPVADD